MITKSSVPHLYPNLHTDKIKNYLLLYNPFANKGVSVVEKKYAFVLELINAKNSVGEIINIFNKRKDGLKAKDLLRLFDLLIFYKIITFNKKDFEKVTSPRNTTTLWITLGITNQCNLRCQYCYVSKTSARMDKQLARRALKKSIDAAKNYKYKKTVITFFGGECLLRLPLVIDLADFVKQYASRKDLEASFVIITNGTLITEKIAKLLADKRIRVGVSLDGIGKFHDRQRPFANGSGSFAYVVKGIQNLQKAKANFGVSTVISAKNIENIPELTRYFLKHNIRFSFSFYRENACVQDELESDPQKLIKYLKKTYKIINKYSTPYYSVMSQILDRIKFSGSRLKYCAVGESYIFIKHDGKLVSCQMTQDRPIGSIEDKDIIKTMREGSFTRPKSLTVEDRLPCKNCQWRYICGGGCPFLAYYKKGSFTASSPYCEVYKALIPEVLKIEAKRIILRDQILLSKTLAPSGKKH